MARLRKGGPLRKDGARSQRGRLKLQEDLGTPELIAHKFIATGSTREDISTLGVLRGRNIIDEDHYDAGLEFERCYRAYIGRPGPKASTLERCQRGIAHEFDDAYLARMKVRYWNYLACLQQIGPHVFGLVRDVCLFERSGGLMGHVIAADVVRIDGGLISRKSQTVEPSLRQRIGTLVRGLEAMDQISSRAYSNEASRLIATLEARSRAEEPGLTKANDSA